MKKKDLSFLDDDYAKNFYIFVKDVFYFTADDHDEMEQICQPVYDDAEV